MENRWKRISIEKVKKNHVMMYREIVLSAFAKAKSETPATTKTQWANYLVEVLWNDYKLQVSRRTLLNYYNHYKAQEDDGIISPKATVIEVLCKYLHYPNYAAFIIHHSALDNVQVSNSQTATYVVDGESYRDVVTIIIKRESVIRPLQEVLQSA